MKHDFICEWCWILIQTSKQPLPTHVYTLYVYEFDKNYFEFYDEICRFSSSFIWQYNGLLNTKFNIFFCHFMVVVLLKRIDLIEFQHPDTVTTTTTLKKWELQSSIFREIDGLMLRYSCPKLCFHFKLIAIIYHMKEQHFRETIHIQ